MSSVSDPDSTNPTLQTIPGVNSSSLPEDFEGGKEDAGDSCQKDHLSPENEDVGDDEISDSDSLDMNDFSKDVSTDEESEESVDVEDLSDSEQTDRLTEISVVDESGQIRDGPLKSPNKRDDSTMNESSRPQSSNKGIRHKCKACGKSDIQILESHLRKKPLCQSEYTAEEIAEVRRSRKPKKINASRCKVCHKNGIKRMNSHLAHKPECRKVYLKDEEYSGPTCRGCGKANIKRIRTHFALLPRCKAAYTVEELAEALGSPEDAGIMCKGCFQTDVRKIQLHLNRRPQCQKAYSPEELKVVMGEEGKIGKIRCEICAKVFYQERGLKTHMMKHLKSFECKTCNTNFSTIGALKVHMNEFHSEGRERHACDLCGKVFRRKHSLKLHMKVHTGEKLFKCEICAKCLGSAATLRMHMRLHTGERPWKCEKCGKGCSSKFDYEMHLHKHAGFKLKCNYCDVAYIRPFELRRHMQKRHPSEKFALPERGRITQPGEDFVDVVGDAEPEPAAPENSDILFVV